MNVFYEEEGEFRVGSILTDNETSLQVVAPHGKRSKVKASAVLLRFAAPSHQVFMAEAQQLADAIDLDFLWQCCSEDEFAYASLAEEYYGHAPSVLESASVLIRLHAAPMYFYKKGRGRYKAAPQAALQAALASVERKRMQAAAKAEYIAELAQSRLPADFVPLLDQLLYQPDKNSVAWKALEEASVLLKRSPLRVLEQCGALADTHAYHLQRFVHEHFPKGLSFPELPQLLGASDLPTATVHAYSIDDAATTEIDDAFSLTPLGNGSFRLGIHIAAPALGLLPDSPWERLARERLSTVYFPGHKITMLPEAAVATYSLAAGRVCPALSIYFTVADDFSILDHSSCLEQVMVAENLRHETLEPVFNAETVATGVIDHPLSDTLVWLWRFATHRLRIRKGENAPNEDRPEFGFQVVDGRVSITRRQRGTPIDQSVAELMILANSTWASDLQAAGIAGLFRVQSGGKVRTSTAAGPHDGLGVSHYMWASSPLRRYCDLVNQRQLMAMVQSRSPAYQASDVNLLTAMRDFEAAYEAYAEFQRAMERYWSLRWLLQEAMASVKAVVLRDNLVRLQHLPLTQRVPSLSGVAVGDQVELRIGGVDLLEMALTLEYSAVV
jgi:exoribonuclease-2